MQVILNTMSAVFRLAELRKGQRAVVERVEGERSTACRLLELGLVAGTELRLTHVAPFGDPLRVELRGYGLLLRRKEAHSIWVKAHPAGEER